MHHGRRFRERTERHGGGCRRGVPPQGILPSCVVHRSGVPPLRAGLGKWRSDRRQFPQPWRKEKKDGTAQFAAGRGSLNAAASRSHNRHAGRLWHRRAVASANHRDMIPATTSTVREIPKMSVNPTKAMVLAAGLGVRMRPLTDRIPKPLVRVAGRALLDHVLDKLGDAGAGEAVVNVHYLPDQIIEHVAARAQPRVIISDERDQVLGTGGGVVKALPLLRPPPFFLVNADTLWIDAVRPNLARLAEAFEPSLLDILP